MVSAEHVDEDGADAGGADDTRPCGLKPTPRGEGRDEPGQQPAHQQQQRRRRG